MNVFENSLLLSFSKPESNVKAKLDYLLKQKTSGGIFDKHMGTNFLALSAILKHRPDFVNGKTLAKILTTLTQIESAEGGPYYSELHTVSKKIALDTNVIIGYFLSLQNVDLDSVDEYIDKAIQKKDFRTELFGSELFVVYFISKFYSGNKKQLLINFLEKSEPKSTVDTLLISLSLYNLGLDVSKLKKKLSAKIKKTPTDELEKAIYHELLEKFRKEVTEESKYTTEEKQMMTLILKAAKARFSSLFGDMPKLAQQEINKTIEGNSDKQMSLTPLYMRKAIGAKGKEFSDNLIAQMGLANIFYWTAFIIYDDFWDEDEAANPQVLPTANLYARHYSNFFTSLLPDSSGFTEFFHELMDKLDAANTWETKYCRTKVDGNKFSVPETLPKYGNYERKYQPASGHVLGPVAMLVQLGYKLNSQEVSNLIEYFKHYLIGMQINDDAHDWEEDMQRGHLSTVVVLLLKEWIKKYPKKKEIDLIKDKEELQKLFWFETIEKACNTAISHTKKSRNALHQIKILKATAAALYYRFIYLLTRRLG